MPRFLAIDWDHQQLHVIAATITGGKIVVQHALSWPEPVTPNPATAADLGKQLRDRLKAAGIAPAPVLACVGRDRVIPKDVRHPPVGPAEEPNLVRLQVIKELSDAPDEVVIDYVPAGQGNTPNERRSFALVLRKELLQAYQTLCQAAGLKLMALTPRMFGTAACFGRVRATPLLLPPAAAHATVAVVAMGERWAEFIVVQAGTLVFARPLSVGPNLAGEIRRNLAVYAGQSAQHPVSDVYIAGGSEQLDLQQKLHGMVSVPVALFDPFGPIDQPTLPDTGRSGFCGALGLLYLQAAGERLPINFVRPRQPVAATDPNRRLYVLAACLLGLLLIGGGGFLVWRSMKAEQQLRELQAEKANLDLAIAALEEDEKRFKALDDWNRSEVVWLDELYDLTDRLGDARGIRLTQVTGDPLPRAANSKSDLVARMTIKGLTTDDPRPVDVLLTEMVRDGYYRVEPKTMKQNRGIERGNYSQEFSTKVDVRERGSDKYVRKMPDLPKIEDRRPRAARPAGEFDPFGGAP